MTPKEAKQEIIKRINNMSGEYTPYAIFTDWIHTMAIAISNGCRLIHDEVWKKREADYMDLLKKHGVEKMAQFGEMMGMLTIVMQEEPSDVLGEIYMESGCGSKSTGQFFTPYHVSRMMAEMAVAQNPPKEGEKYTVNEPSCGGGGMIIAVADALYRRGLNHQKLLKVTAQDLDWNSVYMTYVQLALMGIDAVVVQCNTLTEPDVDRLDEIRKLRTPKNVGMLL